MTGRWAAGVLDLALTRGNPRPGPVSKTLMKRAALVPFALPGPMGRRMPLLWWPQLVLLIGGVLLVALCIVLLAQVAR